jgi:hypothetical protein
MSLGLQAYLFEVELHGDQWKIEVECASEEGWKTVTLEPDWDRLLESRNDSKVRHVLLKSWRGKFSGGKLCRPSHLPPDERSDAAPKDRAVS